MDFRLSSEQEMLRDSARRLVAERLDFNARRNHGGEWAANWRQMAELGWFMLPVDEAFGGLSGQAADIAIITEELGRGIAEAPFIHAALLPARLIEQAGSTEQHAAYLPVLINGSRRFAAALQDAGAGFNSQPTRSRADRSVDGSFMLTGKKILVFGGGDAEIFVVSAMVDSAASLFLVDCGATGVSRRDYETIDGRRVSDLSFNGVELSEANRLGRCADTAGLIEAVLDEAIVALCADTLGVMDRAIEMTADYLKVREQFGQKLASFQVLQHGVANMFIEANDARSLVYRAMAALTQLAPQRSRAVSACKVKVLEAARSVTGSAVHFHGGIGVAAEVAIGHYLRRVLVSEQMFGNAQYHFERFVALAA